MNKNLRILGFIISGVPLLAYPMVLMASIMSFAGFDATQTEGGLLLIVAMSFLVLSMLYPVIYLTSLVGSIVIKSPKWKDVCVAVPYLSLVLTVVLFFVWAGLE